MRTGVRHGVQAAGRIGSSLHSCRNSTSWLLNESRIGVDSDQVHPQRQFALCRRKVKPAGKIRPADVLNEVRLAAHHELIALAGPSDVDAFTGALERRRLVDDEHDGTAFESFEAKDVAVENHSASLKLFPVGGVASGLAFFLFGVAGAGGQERDVFGSPNRTPDPTLVIKVR